MRPRRLWRMPSRTKTLILPFHPDINPGKLRQITKITKRCTFAVSLFLDEAKAKQLYDSKTLEQCRKSIETRTGLSSGFVQACRDQAKTVLKPYPDRLKQWETKHPLGDIPEALSGTLLWPPLVPNTGSPL